jgi:RNA polymerase sigma factor (sigma-70 family)
VSNGDADDALTVLARERAGALFGYAYLLAGNRDAAADLVQEGLVRTFSRTRRGFTPDDAERYVRRAILSAYLDGARRSARWARVRHLFGSPDDEPAAPSPEAAVTAAADVRLALLRLSSTERAVAVLRYAEDLPVAEVAARLGLAEGSVKRYLSDARHKLEPLLGPLADEDDLVVVPAAPRTRASSARAPGVPSAARSAGPARRAPRTGSSPEPDAPSPRMTGPGGVTGGPR